MILALETSCDDTCAAVLDEQGRIRSNVISSQEVHDRFGGVVPEIASRRHLEIVNLVVTRRSSGRERRSIEIDLVAATRGPGLVGALLVGFATAKALAAARELPFAAVDHLQGHVAANFIAGAAMVRAGSVSQASVRSDLGRSALPQPPKGTVRAALRVPDRQRRPHAAGARARARGLRGAGRHARRRGRGGVRQGRAHARPRLPRRRRARSASPRRAIPTAFPFSAGGPRPGLGVGRQAFAHSLDFSFAGLKTALLYRVRELSEDELAARAVDLAASYQAAIVERLLERAERALRADRPRPPRGRRGGRGQRRAAPAPGASWARACTCPSGCCAPTTPR